MIKKIHRKMTYCIKYDIQFKPDINVFINNGK